jgi:uncharacterized membrane protein YqjE
MPEASLGQLVSELISDLGQLVRQELRLAQSEMSDKFKQALNGLYAIVTGLLVAFCALLILLQALVIALSNAMPPWLAAVVVGGALAVFAFILIRQGRENLKARNLIPERSLKAGRKAIEVDSTGQ